MPAGALGGRSAHGLRVLTRPIVGSASRAPTSAGPLALAGAIALGAGIGRSRGVGFDREAVLTLVIGIVLMAALLPMLARTDELAPAAPVGAVGRAPLAAGLAGAGRRRGLVCQRRPASAISPASPTCRSIGGGKSLQGRAYAIGADTLRVGGTTVKLTGIDAPESEQRCGKAARAWRCGAAAEAALSRLVNGRNVSCTLSGSDDAGRGPGQCAVGDKDVGAELVRQGHVFADGSIPRRATPARSARRAPPRRACGAAMSSVRPPTAPSYGRRPSGARRRAVPSRGRSPGASRTYVLPWSPDYERARVQKARGERWFCSEQEAVSAGFKAAQRG